MSPHFMIDVENAMEKARCLGAQEEQLWALLQQLIGLAPETSKHDKQWARQRVKEYVEERK